MDSCSPEGAAVNSQGRQPLEGGDQTDLKPQRGGRAGSFAPLGLRYDWSCSQGLAPLAINGRPRWGSTQGMTSPFF
jgi:hypothetical protein